MILRVLVVDQPRVITSDMVSVQARDRNAIGLWVIVARDWLDVRASKLVPRTPFVRRLPDGLHRIIISQANGRRSVRVTYL